MQCRFGLVWDALQETLHRLVEHAMQLQCTTTSSSGIVQIPSPSSSLLTHWRCYPHLCFHWNSKCCNISIKNNKSAPPAAPQTWASIKKWLNSNLSWLKSVKYFHQDNKIFSSRHHTADPSSVIVSYCYQPKQQHWLITCQTQWVEFFNVQVPVSGG